MIFRHTSSEPGLWRGWLSDGQSLEVSWPCDSVGIEMTSHGFKRHLNVSFGLAQIFVPLGLGRIEYTLGEAPRWGVSLSREFGVTLSWAKRYRSWRWPFHRIVLEHAYKARDGTWAVVNPGRILTDGRFPGAQRETHPYRYRLRSGDVQERAATVVHERWTFGRNMLGWLGWPKQVTHNIDASFDGEVGERSGSWKGGTIGCGYTMQHGEQPIDTLRRMERERKFT